MASELGRRQIPQGSGGMSRLSSYRPAMSHRQAVVVMGVLGIFAFRWWVSGKLGNAAKAWAGPGGPNVPKDPQGAATGTGGATASGTSGGAVASGGAGHPPASLFGLAPGSFADAIGSMGIIDSQGIKAFGGGPAVHDWDYGTPIGTAVKDPIGATYLGDDSGPWGHAAVFRADAGGVFELMHLADLLGLSRGQHVGAGSIIGHTGGPYPAQYWSGPHLAVIADQFGAASLQGTRVAP